MAAPIQSEGKQMTMGTRPDSLGLVIRHHEEDCMLTIYIITAPTPRLLQVVSPTTVSLTLVQ